MQNPRKSRVLHLDQGGPERIRTAVEAFAELCLATRPQDPLLKTAHFQGFCS